MLQPSAQSEFIQFGPAHLTVIALLIIFSVALSMIVQRTSSEKIKRSICWTLAAILLSVEFCKYVFTLTQYGFEFFLQYSLPLHMCGIAVYLAAYMLITRRQVAFEILYFWALGGTTQAILTPAVTAGFPSYRFFQFFLEHSIVIIAVLVAIFGFKMRPRVKGTPP